jgi:hypothetical protein
VIYVHVEGVLAQHLGEKETGERQLDQHVLVQRLEQFKKRFILFQVQNESYFCCLFGLWICGILFT